MGFTRRRTRSLGESRLHWWNCVFRPMVQPSLRETDFGMWQQDKTSPRSKMRALAYSHLMGLHSF